MPYSMMLYDDDDKAPPALNDLFRVVAVEPDTHDVHRGRGTYVLLEPYTGEDQLMAALTRRRADLAQARAKLAQTETERINDCRAATMWEGIAQEREHALAQARAELKDLQVAKRVCERLLAQKTNSRDYWVETCLAAEGERNEARKEAQKQSDIAKATMVELKRVHKSAHVEAEGLRRQLAQARAELAAVDGAAISKLRLRLQDTEIALQTERRLRQEAELAAHVHDKACGELAQTVRTERALRQEAEQRAKNREAELVNGHKALTAAGVVRSDASGYKYSIAGRVVRLRKAEQRAERAEARAQLVTPELAALLERLAQYANLYDAPESAYNARATAARIREALALEGDEEETNV